MSTRLKARKKDPSVWQQRVAATRTGVTKTLCDIRAGVLDEDDLDKLQNFCMFSLALMDIVGSEKWAQAKVNAEILALQHVDTGENHE